MRGAMKFELLTAVFTALALLVPLTTPSVAYAQAGAAGYVKSLSPTVFIRKGSGAQVPAKVGDVLSPGSTVVTGAAGKVDLLFADGLQISLGKESVLRIDDYRFDAANPREGRANISLVNGRMSMVTGAIHTDNATGLRLSAGTGTISVLSKDVTAFVVEVDPDEKQRPGWAAVTVGAIAIQTPSGRISQIAADQFARWRDGERQLEALPLAAAPAVLQAQVTASRATIAEASQPVDVQSASVQAALMLSQAKAQGSASSMTTAALSGQLNMVTGNVQMRSPSGAQSQARVGDTFGPGTTFLTGPKGEVGLLFSEGHYAALGEKSVLRIAGSGTREADTASLALTEGRLSLVTWAYAGEAPVPLNVGVGNALISILSKGVVAYVVEVDSETKDAGSAAVTAGIISVKTPVGPPVAVSSDKYTSWKPEKPPAPLGALAGAPASLQLAFADTIASAPTNAEVAAEVASLPPTAAGPVPAPQPAAPQPTAEPLPQPPPPVALAAVIVPPVAPGGGGGCTGSPC